MPLRICGRRHGGNDAMPSLARKARPLPCPVPTVRKILAENPSKRRAWSAPLSGLGGFAAFGAFGQEDFVGDNFRLVAGIFAFQGGEKVIGGDGGGKVLNKFCRLHDDSSTGFETDYLWQLRWVLSAWQTGGVP